MRNSKLFAILALSAGLVGCQMFTAGEPVSEPDLDKAKAARATYDKQRAEAEGVHKEEGHAHGVHKDHAHEQAKQVAAEPAAPKETATASHILIQYTGAMRAPGTVGRTKEQAEKLAEQLAKKAQKPGANFAKLADEYTEDPSGKGKGGMLGVFERGRMVPEFDKATFALAPGQTSGVVESAFGFHIIYREK